MMVNQKKAESGENNGKKGKPSGLKHNRGKADGILEKPTNNFPAAGFRLKVKS
jgi:hypothetical protein